MATNRRTQVNVKGKTLLERAKELVEEVYVKPGKNPVYNADLLFAQEADAVVIARAAALICKGKPQAQYAFVGYLRQMVGDYVKQLEQSADKYPEYDGEVYDLDQFKTAFIKRAKSVLRASAGYFVFKAFHFVPGYKTKVKEEFAE